MKQKVVACLGSSTTAGKGQAFDWIGELAKRPQNSAFKFLNFGAGGDLAFNVLQRLPDVVAVHPDKVVVIIGGNDILASVFPNLLRFLRFSRRVPQKPTPQWFLENVETMVRELRKKTTARIALTSLPQVGEDPSGSNPVQARINDLYREYAAIIEDLARREGTHYIPMYERLHAEIVGSPGRAFTGFRFFPFYVDTFRYFALHKTGDEIARMNGWRFHVDGIHLNGRGGMLLADLVQEFLIA
jgi:lysophospholipase L1-like esterase